MAIASSVYIYVPENQTLSALEARVATMINYVGSLRAGEGSLASRCNLLWARLNCATYLRPCVHVLGEDGTLKFFEPLQPCQSTCLEYEHLCREYVESQNLAFGVGLYYPPHHTVPLTCQENDTNGKPFYQSANYSITSPTNSNETYSICNGVTSNGTTIVVCEDPLSTVEGTNECAFTCPLPSYTNEQYDALKVLQLVLAWSSWAGSLVVIFSYTLHNKLRQFPSNLILMAAIAAHAESVGMILPTFFGYHNTWCGFDTQYLMPESSIEQGLFALHFNLSGLAARSSLCTFQGWLVQTGFLSSTMWWGIVAFNMFLSVFFGKVLPTTKSWNVGLQVVFHVCGWALPAFIMVIPAAADEITFAPGSTLYAFTLFSSYTSYATRYPSSFLSLSLSLSLSFCWSSYLSLLSSLLFVRFA
ncbi:G-protein coupled receptor Fz Smo, variant 2 [Balamuthia mandrillaris]